MESKALLAEKAKHIRQNIIEMLGQAKSGHPGGSLDLAEIMSVLYFDVMNFDFADPQKEDRDYLVLSKGHGAPVLYGTFCEGGLIEKARIENFAPAWFSSPGASRPQKIARCRSFYRFSGAGLWHCQRHCFVDETAAEAQPRLCYSR